MNRKRGDKAQDEQSHPDQGQVVTVSFHAGGLDVNGVEPVWKYAFPAVIIAGILYFVAISFETANITYGCLYRGF
jgi:hypothetical protein